MKCPSCNILLATSELAAVEIDFCPKCWGVWLDRGELNLILKRSTPPVEIPGSGEVDATSEGPLPVRRPTSEATRHAPGAPISWAEVLSQTR